MRIKRQDFLACILEGHVPNYPYILYPHVKLDSSSLTDFHTFTYATCFLQTLNKQWMEFEVQNQKSMAG